MPAFIEQALHTLEWGMCFLITDIHLAAIRHPDTWHLFVTETCLVLQGWTALLFVLHFMLPFLFYLYEVFLKNFIKRNVSVHIYTSVYKYRNSYKHAPLPCIFVLVCNYTFALSYNKFNTAASSLTQSETRLGEILFQLFMFFAKFSTLSGCTELQRGTSPNILFLPGYLRCTLISC